MSEGFGEERRSGGLEGIRTLGQPVSPAIPFENRSKSRLLYLAELQARRFAVYYDHLYNYRGANKTSGLAAIAVQRRALLFIHITYI